MKLSGTREARLNLDAQTTATMIYGLTPPKRGRFEFGLIAVRYLSRWRLVWSQTRVGAPVTVKVYPNMRRAREAELRALGARSFVAARRKSQWRGEGREFESLRDYVRGDEMRHISWIATARRGKLVTRQYHSLESEPRKRASKPPPSNILHVGSASFNIQTDALFMEETPNKRSSEPLPRLAIGVPLRTASAS